MSLHPRITLMSTLPSIAALVALTSMGWSVGCAKVSRSPKGSQAATAATSPVETFGEKLGTSELVPLALALSNANEYAGRTIKVDGHVRRACSAKGCWMELSQDKSPQSQACRVTFKDYGFFVPTDSAGAQATVEGQVSIKRVRAAQVQHYEAEGATFPVKHEDGSADEVRFVATGVELRRY